MVDVHCVYTGVHACISTTLSLFPRAVAIDDSGIRDLVPESGVLYRVDSLLRVNVQVDTLHDTAERCSETIGKMSVLHTPENMERDGGRREILRERESERGGRGEGGREGGGEGGGRE